MNEVYEWIKANIVNVVNFVAGEYWGNSLVIFILFVSCITLLFLNRDKLKWSYDVLAVYSLLLIVLILLNPLTLKIYRDTRDAFALLPMCAIIACVIAVKSKDITGKIKQNVVIICLAVVVILAGLAIREEAMVDSINSYKVDDQGVIIAKCILENSKYSPVTVCYILRDGEAHGTDLSACEAAKQYSGLIRVETADSVNVPVLGEVTYLVVNNNILDKTEEELVGFEQIANTGSYTILSNMQLQ